MTIRAVGKRFGRRDVLRDVSFALSPGEVVGLVGHNGAGKSTLFRIVAGLLEPDAGGIEFSPTGARIGFLPERPAIYPELTPREFVAHFAELAGHDPGEASRRAEAHLDEVGLTEYKNTVMKRFSKGMMQRASLARALVGEPAILLLDEPESGLDPIARRDLREIVDARVSRGMGAILASHDLKTVQSTCDRVLILRNGSIVRAVDALDRRATGQTFALQVPEAQAERAARFAASLAMVAEVRRRNGVMTVGLRNNGTPDALLAAMVGAGISILFFGPASVDLEGEYAKHAGDLAEVG
ncbi:MAG TPA: ABC transporter ATP-binding protein [Candidatus Thermoplasmatota archaeon]|nr:ABC transporter ATP-binding protein [Candidatus Thermoplasmatota archaeon]